MSDDWTPGAGARTLTPEAGMLGIDRMRVACVSGDTLWRHGDALPYAIEGWHVADLHDPATRYLALAQLARRVGLDPAWGVTWEQDDSDAGQWHLHTPTGGRTYHPRHASERSTHVPGIDTDDPAEALDRALWATRGQP